MPQKSEQGRNTNKASAAGSNHRYSRVYSIPISNGDASQRRRKAPKEDSTNTRPANFGAQVCLKRSRVGGKGSSELQRESRHRRQDRGEGHNVSIVPLRVTKGKSNVIAVGNSFQFNKPFTEHQGASGCSVRKLRGLQEQMP